jgi:hexosaminidase
MMEIIFILMSTFVVLLLATSANAAGPISVVPKPQQAKALDEQFELTNKTRIVIADESLQPIAEYLAAHLSRATGFSPQVVTESAKASDIHLTTMSSDRTLGDEGYTLSCGAAGVAISSPRATGVFYGVQTLRQLFPPQIESKSKVNDVKWIAPGVVIRDWPRFSYRGFMLDSCRHMQAMDYIKRQIDLMALYKLNRFHWHLTEDQGWRVEIKKYPKLTEVGAYRNQTQKDGKRYGGFYTQDQIKEIVRYAADRFIVTIPEVDMPGHMMGALAAFPNLGCTGGPYKVRTAWGIEKDVLCIGSPETFKFAEGVLDEICEMFPSNAIHIGGDEVPRDRWKACPKCQAKKRLLGLKNEDALQNFFTLHIAEYLESKGRRLQGWNEIMEGGDLLQSCVVHIWNNDKHTINAVKSGRDVVYSRTNFLYVDYPLEYMPLAKVYATEPVPAGLSREEILHITGPQANLWTEYLPTDKSCDEYAWPRLAALAEVAWTNAPKRDYLDFVSRMKQSQYARLANTRLAASEDDSVEQIEKSLAERGAIVAYKKERI